jgi:hypothetical protein
VPVIAQQVQRQESGMPFIQMISGDIEAERL